LGLRAAARIVADAGGQLRTSSIPGGGGVAIVSLPLAIPRAAASAIEIYSGDEAFAEQLRGLLAKHWECVVYPSLAGAVDRMRRSPPAVVLLDNRVSDDVVATVRRMKADAELMAVPVLVFAEESGDFYDAGALAVLRLPLDSPRVVANVRRALHLISAAAGQDSRSPPDILTGLPSAGSLSSRLDRELTGARASQTPLPVVMVRINELREINRQHGWLVGDQLILWIAGKLRERVRVDEVVARVDAETFAIALPGRSVGEAQALAAELVDSIARARPRLGVARVDVRVSAQALDLATLAPGDRTLDGSALGGGT
jgi:diguanylate cyclase (GGDEF)-like protein